MFHGYVSHNQKAFGHLGAHVGAYFGAQPIGISRAGLEPWLGGVASPQIGDQSQRKWWLMGFLMDF